MEWQQIYKDRSMDVETMLDRFVGDGTSVFVGTFEVAGGLIRPMLKRIQDGTLHGISMYGGITSEDLHLDELTVGFDRIPLPQLFHRVATSATAFLLVTLPMCPCTFIARRTLLKMTGSM